MKRRAPTPASLAALACGALLTLAAAPLAAAQRDAVLGRDGEVYMVLAGAYGELFPGGAAAAGTNPVLALDVARPQGPTERLLVAGTEGQAEERSPSLVYEEASNSVFLVWESSTATYGSTLNLVGRAAGEWTEVIQVAGKTARLKGSPQLSVTHDSYRVSDEGGAARTVTRTALHLIWWELGAADEDEEVFYAPIILEDGVYLGWNPVYRLGDLDGADPLEGGTVRRSLVRSPHIAPGRDAKSAVVGMANAATGRLLALEIRILPGELGFLAQELVEYIDALDAGSIPGGVDSLAGDIGAHVVDIGRHFHAGVRGYLAVEAERRAEDHLAGLGGPGVVLRNLAGDIGAHVVDIGSTLFGTDGMNRRFDDERTRLLAIGHRPDEEVLAPGESPPHLLRLHLVSDWAAPAVGAGDAAIYLSPNGERALVSWEQEDRIQYREIQADGAWSGTLTLHLDETLSRERARDILAQRIRER